MLWRDHRRHRDSHRDPELTFLFCSHVWEPYFPGQTNPEGRKNCNSVAAAGVEDEVGAKDEDEYERFNDRVVIVDCHRYSILLVFVVII